MNNKLDDIARELEDVFQGVSPLQQALEIAELMREEFGGEWVVEGKPDDTYIVTQKK